VFANRGSNKSRVRERGTGDVPLRLIVLAMVCARGVALVACGDVLSSSRCLAHRPVAGGVCRALDYLGEVGGAVLFTEGGRSAAICERLQVQLGNRGAAWGAPLAHHTAPSEVRQRDALGGGGGGSGAAARPKPFSVRRGCHGMHCLAARFGGCRCGRCVRCANRSEPATEPAPDSLFRAQVAS